MPDETYVEITFRVPLKEHTSVPAAFGTAGAHAADIDANPQRELVDVTFVAGGHRMELGEMAIRRLLS